MAIALFGPRSTRAEDVGTMMLALERHMRPVRVTIPDVFVVLRDERESRARYFKPDEPGPAFLTMLEDQILRILQLAE